ncbi:hypothetical protein D6792_00315 [Candidatus Parcubacteria bacterium]|nr:MAG: hypothetical protein D6792_00315 [Candidatus Parcubacteria bacterium]
MEEELLEVATPAGKVFLRRIESADRTNRPETDDTFIVYISGWGESPALSRQFASRLSEMAEMPVWYPDYHQLDGNTEPDFLSPRLQKLADSFAIPPTETHRADGFVPLIEKATSIVFVAHSEGAIAAALLSLAYGEKTQSPVILIAPAGLDVEGFGVLVGRFVRQFLKGLTGRTNSSHTEGTRATNSYHLEVLRYLIMNPIQLVRDAWALAKIDLRPLLKEITKMQKQVLCILYKHDQLFSSFRVMRGLREIFPGISIQIIQGVHAQPHIDPTDTLRVIQRALKKQ